jgi:hypothetical protein
MKRLVGKLFDRVLTSAALVRPGATPSTAKFPDGCFHLFYKADAHKQTPGGTGWHRDCAKAIEELMRSDFQRKRV